MEVYANIALMWIINTTKNSADADGTREVPQIRNITLYFMICFLSSVSTIQSGVS